jgi:hypothetical protein
MEEDWYSMEWLVTERKQEVATHQMRVARVRSEGCEAKRPKPSAGEHRRRWPWVGDLTVTGAGGLVWALAAGLTLVGAPRIQKHWRRPPAPGRAAP